MDPYHHQSMHDSHSISFPIHPPPLIYHASLGESRRGGGRRRPGAKLSTDPQSVAARERRHRISDRFRVLRSLVPGGSKMDTVSMLEQAIHYVKFLKAQVSLHQAALMQHEEASGHVFSGAASATSANDEVVQLPVPVDEAVGYHTGQVQGLLDHPGQISSSHELPPLPSCLFVEEPAAACYSVRSLHDEETDVHGSY